MIPYRKQKEEEMQMLTYRRSHHEIGIVIGHSLGGSVSLALEKQYKKEGNRPYGNFQSKTFGAPVVSGSIGSSLGKVGKPIVKIRYYILVLLVVLLLAVLLIVLLDVRMVFF